MKYKSAFLFALMSISLLSGCNNNNKTALFSNVSRLTNTSLNVENCFVEGTEELVDKLMSTKTPFVIYFTQEDCQACSSFMPIVTSWTISTSNLVVKFGPNDGKRLNTKYDKMFSNPDTGMFQCPTVGVINKNSKFENVDYYKHMKTKTAFNSYMSKYYKVSNLYFFEDNVDDINVDSQVSRISYNIDSEISKNIYNEKLLPLLNNSSKKIILNTTHQNDDVLLENIQLKSNDVSTITNQLNVSLETSLEDIQSYL